MIKLYKDLLTHASMRLQNSFIQSLSSNKYALIITLIFFIIILNVTIFSHHYWFETDGILIVHIGEQILKGDGKNLLTPDLPDGGGIIYGIVNLIIKDEFITAKIISLISGTGIVLLSYYITKNVFNTKIAVVVQLFVACNPRLALDSIYAMNDLVPIFFIFVSLYFITKKDLRLSDLMISGSVLGISSIIRFQGLIVLIAFLIFLLVRSNQIKINLLHFSTMGIFFVIALSPLLLYDYYTHGDLIDTNSNFYLLTNWNYQTLEWHNKIEQNIMAGISDGLFLDHNLFLKNYFYDLFYHNPNRLFNFGTVNNFSIIPEIPFLGIIPVMLGAIYVMKISINKKNIIILLGTGLSTTFFVFSFGEISIHFFAIIIIPLLVIGITNIKKIQKNFLVLLILSVVFFIIISIVPVGKAEHLFAMWLIIPILSTIFFIETLPHIFSKIRSLQHIKSRNIQKMTISLIVLILVANLAFSYLLLHYSLYTGDTYSTDLKKEFTKLFERKNQVRELGFDEKQIGDMLSKQPGIENSYVMSSDLDYSYYAHSKFVYTTFREGVKNDSLNKFITRENWTPYDRFFSDIISYPTDRFGKYHPIPDYLVYQPIPPNAIQDPWSNINDTQFEDLKILLNPNDPMIPSNFELLFKSNVTGTVVYKIKHDTNK